LITSGVSVGTFVSEYDLNLHPLGAVLQERHERHLRRVHRVVHERRVRVPAVAPIEPSLFAWYAWTRTPAESLPLEKSFTYP